FGVQNRLSLLENALTELKKENAELRTHLAGKLETLVNDAKNTIQDSIRVPQDGKDGLPGRDGADGRDGESIKGDRGEQGDVVVIGETELAKEVIRLRIKLKEQHAAFLARLIEVIEANRGPNSSSSARILATHMEGIKKEIERLR